LRFGRFAAIDKLLGEPKAVQEDLGAAFVDAAGGKNAQDHGDAVGDAGQVVRRRQFQGGPMEPGVEIAEQGAAHGG